MDKRISNIIKKGNNNLDLIRLFAALAVVIYHSFAINPEWGFSDPTKSFFGHTSTGGVAVKIFFFISGLLVTNSIITKKSAIEFLLSRTLRTFPGLILVTSISALIIGPVITDMKLNEYLLHNGTYMYIVNNIIMNTSFVLPGVSFDNVYGINGSLWTIRYEVAAYIILVISFMFGLMKSNIISSLICLFIIIEPITPLKGVLFASSDNSAIFLLAPCFALGSFFAINKNWLKSTLTVPVILLLASIYSHSPTLSPLLLCFSFCLFAFHISSVNWIINLRLKSDISYGVYLWGFPVLQIAHKYFSSGPILGIVISIIASCIMGYASWVLIEKPCIKLSKRVCSYYSDSVLIKNTAKE
jgi:peptidoglycan/LPS O-acetylase OafA/YrhL